MRNLKTFILTLLLLVVGSTMLYAQYNRDYFYYVGRNLITNNNYEEAIRTLNTILQHDADAYEGFFYRGVAKLNLDDLYGAEADFSSAIDKNPVYTTAYTYRAITRLRMGNYEDALSDFAEAIALRPDIPNPYYSRGVTRLLNKQYAEAIADFDAFIRREKMFSDAYINRGLAYLNLRDTLRAFQNFDMAVKTNRENPNAYNKRASLFIEQQRYNEAEGDLNLAIKSDSSYLASYFNRAIVYSSTNRPTKAIEDLNRVVALDSTSSITYFNRAIVRSQIGDYNRALADYDKVVQYSPQNVLVYFYRANLKTQLGNIEGAEADYSKAIELYPDFASAYINRSNVRMLLRKPKAARNDRLTANRKIAEYKSKLKDSTYSIYADTTLRFDKLLSFDVGVAFDNVAKESESRLMLIPSVKFTIIEGDTTLLSASKFNRTTRIDEFKRQTALDGVALSYLDTDLSGEELVARDAENRKVIDRALDYDWVMYFNRGVTQTLVKQYTAAVNSYTAAIELNPKNPFLYLNRAAVRAEMIDFISSIDNSYHHIAIDTDPVGKLRQSGKKTYSYNDAIEDLNEAIALYPDFAAAYFNRANLLALSGYLPEAYEDYTRAIALEPQFAEAYYNRGLVQIFMNDTRKGCLDMSKAGELGIKEAYNILNRYSKPKY